MMVTKGAGTRVRALREAAGISQRDFARRVGMSNGHLSLWERGERKRIGADILCRVARELGVTVEMLVDEGKPAASDRDAAFSAWMTSKRGDWSEFANALFATISERAFRAGWEAHARLMHGEGPAA